VAHGSRLRLINYCCPPRGLPRAARGDLWQQCRSCTRRAARSERRTAADCGSSKWRTAAEFGAQLSVRVAHGSRLRLIKLAHGSRLRRAVLSESGARQPIAAYQSGARQPIAARTSQREWRTAADCGAQLSVRVAHGSRCGSSKWRTASSLSRRERCIFSFVSAIVARLQWQERSYGGALQHRRSRLDGGIFRGWLERAKRGRISPAAQVAAYATSGRSLARLLARADRWRRWLRRRRRRRQRRSLARSLVARSLTARSIDRSLAHSLGPTDGDSGSGGADDGDNDARSLARP